MAVKVTKQAISTEDLAKEIRSIVFHSTFNMPIFKVYSALSSRGIEAVSFSEFAQAINSLVSSTQVIICVGVDTAETTAEPDRIFCYLKVAVAI